MQTKTRNQSRQTPDIHNTQTKSARTMQTKTRNQRRKNLDTYDRPEQCRQTPEPKQANPGHIQSKPAGTMKTGRQTPGIY
eukprot:Pgem_evm1s10796